MSGRGPSIAAVAPRWGWARFAGTDGARGAADVWSPTTGHGDAELFAAKSWCVGSCEKDARDARSDPQNAEDPVVTVSGPQRGHVTRPQGTQIRHLDQHRLPAIPGPPPPPPQCRPILRGCQPAVHDHSVARGRRRQQPAIKQVAADPARRARLRRRGAQRAFAAPSVRLRREHGLYADEQASVTFMTPTRFAYQASRLRRSADRNI